MDIPIKISIINPPPVVVKVGKPPNIQVTTLTQGPAGPAGPPGTVDTTSDLLRNRDFDLRLEISGVTLSDYDSAKAEIREYPGAAVISTLTYENQKLVLIGPQNYLDIHLLASETQGFPLGNLKFDIAVYNQDNPGSIKNAYSGVLTISDPITEV